MSLKTNSLSNRKRIFLKTLVSISTILGIVGVHWLATSSEILLEGLWHSIGKILPSFIHDHEQGAVFLGSLALIGTTSYIVWRFRHLFGPKLKNLRRAHEDPRSCIIFLVSSENFKTGEARLTYRESEAAKTDWLLDGNVFFESGELENLSVSDRINLLCDRANETKFPWPWQQILRGLPPHLNELREVWLVGSPGDFGSFRSLPRLAKFLQQLLGSNITVLIDAPAVVTRELSEEEAATEHHQGVDFEDFGALVERLRSLITRITGERKTCRVHDVVIDATGGQKTTSIAAAAVTLNSDVVFQYVQTASPWHPLIYDTVFEIPASGGH